MRHLQLLIGLMLWSLAMTTWGQQAIHVRVADGTDDPPTVTATRPEYPQPESSPLSFPDLESPIHDGACDACLRKQRQRGTTRSARFYSALIDALCPCDNCYRPAWHPLDSASFFVDSARTQNRTRIRWDYGMDMMFPDRAEYFWARVGALGPDPPPGAAAIDRFDYHDLSIYAEIAHGKFSAFTVTPYRSLYLGEEGHAAGFSDMQIGTKSMLYDSPLMQLTLQMTTTVPSANPKKGLGTGHVSLEPALLYGLSLTDRDSLQARIGEWIPLGGDPDYAGALLRWGVAWNRIAWQRDPGNLMTINLDLAGWSFQTGSYTDPNLGRRSANDETYFYLGPGMRFLFCSKFELGTSGLFALTEHHFAENLLRTEMTIRY